MKSMSYEVYPDQMSSSEVRRGQDRKVGKVKFAFKTVQTRSSKENC